MIWFPSSLHSAKKTQKSAHINPSPLCAIMPECGEDWPCSSCNLNTASWRFLSFLSSRWYCCRWLFFTALLRCFSWHSLCAAMYICCWRASSASKELSLESCVTCSWLVYEIRTYWNYLNLKSMSNDLETANFYPDLYYLCLYLSSM